MRQVNESFRHYKTSESIKTWTITCDRLHGVSKDKYVGDWVFGEERAMRLFIVSL